MQLSTIGMLQQAASSSTVTTPALELLLQLWQLEKGRVTLLRCCQTIAKKEDGRHVCFLQTEATLQVKPVNSGPDLS